MAKHELAALESEFQIVREKPAIEPLLHSVKTVEDQIFSLGEEKPATEPPTERPRNAVAQCCEIIKHARNLFDGGDVF